MADLTADTLARIFAPTPLARCAIFLDPLKAAMAEFDINTRDRKAAFLGQVGIESQMLTKVRENMNYRTPSRLDEMFSAVRGDADAAALIAKGPNAIANRVYANRMGNGDEASGDGARYMGAGLIQLTGKDNQSAFASFVKVPLADVSGYLLTPAGASRSAAWYFATLRHCNALADAWNISGITRAVNGNAMAAAAERLALSNKARGMLS